MNQKETVRLLTIVNCTLLLFTGVVILIYSTVQLLGPVDTISSDTDHSFTPITVYLVVSGFLPLVGALFAFIGAGVCGGQKNVLCIRLGEVCVLVDICTEVSTIITLWLTKVSKDEKLYSKFTRDTSILFFCMIVVQNYVFTYLSYLARCDLCFVSVRCCMFWDKCLTVGGDEDDAYISERRRTIVDQTTTAPQQKPWYA